MNDGRHQRATCSTLAHELDSVAYLVSVVVRAHDTPLREYFRLHLVKDILIHIASKIKTLNPDVLEDFSVELFLLIIVKIS